eukprot:2593324-Rhodomonas_salina.1
MHTCSASVIPVLMPRVMMLLHILSLTSNFSRFSRTVLCSTEPHTPKTNGRVSTLLTFDFQSGLAHTALSAA